MTYEISLPEVGAAPVGYAALIRDYELRVPSPLILSAIGVKHKKYETPHWRVFTPRHTPEDSLYGHLVFALRYEGIDLSVLSALFYAVSADDIRAIIRHEPTGAYARRIWFLYEHTHAILDDITDADRGNYIDVLDAKLQYPGPPRLSKRHRVRNNLPGVADFCPLIRRTPELERFIAGNSADTARKAVGAVHPDMLLRAASFLLLEDSKASYAIEGETPPLNRTERWGRIIGQAGKTALSREELERLQREVIADTRFIHMGYRREGGFIGTHDRTTNMPVPAHISAHHDDIERLIQGTTHLTMTSVCVRQ